MTAVLGYIDNGMPCLLGDIMISSPTKPSKHVTLPVSGQEAKETPIRWGTHFFTDFRQKLNLISPYMMVGWAGSLIEARVTIKSIRQKYNEINPTDFKQLEQVIYSIDKLELKNISLIAVIANDERWRMIHLGQESKRFTTP